MTEQQIIFAGVGTFITLIIIFCIVKLIRKATAEKKTAEQTTKIEVENFEEVTIETDDNIEEEPITSPQADNITIIKTKVKDVYHISQNKNDKSDHSKEWRVRKQGSEKTIKYFSIQKEAIQFAEESASKNNGKVVIHKLSGDIRKNKYS